MDLPYPPNESVCLVLITVNQTPGCTLSADKSPIITLDANMNMHARYLCLIILTTHTYETKCLL